jgi:hypothetical protein
MVSKRPFFDLCGFPPRSGFGKRLPYACGMTTPAALRPGWSLRLLLLSSKTDGSQVERPRPLQLRSRPARTERPEATRYLLPTSYHLPQQVRESSGCRTLPEHSKALGSARRGAVQEIAVGHPMAVMVQAFAADP